MKKKEVLKIELLIILKLKYRRWLIVVAGSFKFFIPGRG